MWSEQYRIEEKLFSLIDDEDKDSGNVSSDDLPVVSVMPAMTLHEVDDMDEDTSSYHGSFSHQDSQTDVRDRFPHQLTPSNRMRTEPREFEEIKLNNRSAAEAKHRKHMSHVYKRFTSTEFS